MYDVMAIDRVRRSPLGAPPRPRGRDVNLDGQEDWSPDRHRIDRRRRDRRADPGARRPRAELRLPVLRLPDRRRPARAHGAGRGRALRRGVRQPRRGHRAARAGRPRDGRRRARPRDGRGARASAAGTVVNATGVWADRLRPGELHDEAEVPGHPPEPRHPPPDPERRSCRVVDGAIAPAGGGRTIFVLPWLGQTLIGTTDNDYEGRARPRPAGRGGRRSTCSTPPTRSSHATSSPATSPAPTRACGR